MSTQKHGGLECIRIFLAGSFQPGRSFLILPLTESKTGQRGHGLNILFVLFQNGLKALFGELSPASTLKEIDYVQPVYRRIIAASRQSATLY